MLDLTQELSVLQLIPLATETATVTGTGVLVNNLDTGDLDMASLNVIAVTGSGTITVQLQSSASLSTGYTNLATTALMPNTAFPVVTAALTAPATLAIDPRAIGPYIRAVATVVGISAFTIEVMLFGRALQIGFNTNSG